MPRPLAVLLVASLLANAALLVVVGRHAARSTADAFGTGASGTSAPAFVASHPPAPDPAAAADALSAELAVLLNRKDPARLHALLLGAGVDSEIRAQLVQMALWKNYEPKLKALDPNADGDAGAIWWKEPGGHVRNDSPEERERNRAYNLLNEEIAAEYQRITGEDPDAFDPKKQPWLARQYGGLPHKKAETLYFIGRDYDELRSEIQREIGAFELPQDQEKLRLLEAERERDIAALLTPEERANWEMRSSETADQLRYRMTQLDATEEEYRRIYALKKAFETEFDSSKGDELATRPDGTYDDFWIRREAAEARLEEEIRAVVGEERYTAAALENDPDFTNARAAAERLGLPADTAPRLIALREPAAAESRRIAADPQMDPDQKKAALARLAATTRAQVVQTLGAAAAEAYFKRGAMNWLNRFEQGLPIALKPRGGYETLGLESDTTP